MQYSFHNVDSNLYIYIYNFKFHTIVIGMLEMNSTNLSMQRKHTQYMNSFLSIMHRLNVHNTGHVKVGLVNR